MSRPRSASSAGGDAAVLASACGLDLYDWQREVLDAGLSEVPDGQWAAPDVAVIASRQNGKSAAAAARELYGLGVLREQQIHTAHEFKTTRESFDQLCAYVDAGPLAEMLVRRVGSPMTGYSMRFSNGARISFIARSRSSGRGMTADLLVFDEAQELDDAALGALVPVLSARPVTQKWFLGSAPGEHSSVWHRIRNQGRAGMDRLAFFEFSADPKADLDDREAWAQANPLFGAQISEATIESERRVMSDEMFARERLSISPDLEDLSDRPFTMDAWHHCGDHASQIVGRVFVAVDVTPSGDECAVGVAGVRADGVEHVEVVCFGLSPSETERKIGELFKRYGGPVVLDETGPAGWLKVPLEKAGVTVEATSARQMAQACSGLANAVREKTVRHVDQRVLTAAVKDAAVRPLGDGGWAWGRKNSTVDISPLVAVTLARWALTAVEAPKPSFAPRRIR